MTILGLPVGTALMLAAILLIPMAACGLYLKDRAQLLHEPGEE